MRRRRRTREEEEKDYHDGDVIEEGEDPSSTIPAAQPIDEDGNLITPNGKILKAIPVEKWEEDGEPVDPVGEALPAIPVDEAPVAIPVEEDE